MGRETHTYHNRTSEESKSRENNYSHKMCCQDATKPCDCKLMSLVEDNPIPGILGSRIRMEMKPNA